MADISESPVPISTPSPEAQVPVSPPAPPSQLRQILFGPNGLRAGWRFLIFGLTLYGLSAVVFAALQFFAHRYPALGGNPNTLIPARLLPFEVLNFLLVCLGTWIMAKIERRRFGVYGLPWTSGLGRDVAIGALWGFGTISGTLLVIFSLHGYRITGLALHGQTILVAVLEWSIVFIFVGLFEEFSFRGYIQFTLTTGMGFWPSAILLSALFGFVHRGNSGENLFGELSVVCFGLLFCLVLRRKGNLWWAVGFHAGYDWGQTFFFGVPDSGLLAYNNLLNSSFQGPKWLTGGTVGPEASIFTPIALLIVGILFSRVYRDVRYRPLSQ
jgi:membrane protease YdiL (CAAX protease family)